MQAEQSNSTEAIHIAIGFDNKFLRQACTLISSLVANHGKGQIEIHAIAEGVADADRRHVTTLLENSGNSISYYTVDQSIIEQFVLTGRWTAVVYYRLFFPMLVKKPIRRLLYLDCDTLVINPLWTLYHTTMDGHPVAAVYDNYVKVQPLLNIVVEGEYFNSGVMLIDIARWKQQQISEKAFEYLKKHPENILFVDQCALNFVLHKNWKKLDNRFNLMYSCIPEAISKKELIHIIQENVVIHFTLQRPWQMLCRNRLRSLYLHYLKRSGIRPIGWRGYDDFKLEKIAPWLRIRLHEYYFDVPFLQKVWRFISAK